MKTRKILFSVVALLLFPVFLQAQYLRTSYFMEGTHYRLQLNPALSPEKGYINLPMIGALNASVYSSSIGMKDAVDIMKNTEDSRYFLSDDFMGRLSNQNTIDTNISTDIISVGWYKGKNFWSFNVGLRADIGVTVPKSMFQFMRNMDALDFSKVESFQKLNELVENQKVAFNTYTEMGVGFARSINSRLSVGGKVKMLLGIGNMEMNIHKISVKSNIVGYPSGVQWEDLTLEQLNGISGSAEIDVDASLISSSKGFDFRENEKGYIDEFKLNSKEKGFAGFGAAIDLGVAYKLTDRLLLSASVVDLGFINWSKNNTMTARSLVSRKYNLTNEEERAAFSDLINRGEVLNYELFGLKKEQQEQKNRNHKLASTVVLGAEYALLNDWLVLGGLYTARFAQTKTLNEITLSGNIRPKSYLNLSVSYSILQSAGKSFGLAAKVGPFFLGTDYMFLGDTSRSVNAYLGISIPLSGKKNKKADL